jgi:hypothetical protein
MFLYEDFPNVDLVVDFTDHPQLCNQNIPFLRFSILNASGLGTPQQQRQYNITDLLAPAWIPHGYATQQPPAAAPAAADSAGQQASSADAVQLPQYTRGFTIPSPEAWRALSLTPPQLQEYQRCLQETYPWSAKRKVLFWRGQATGCSRGWPVPGLQQKVPTLAAGADGSAGSSDAVAAAAMVQPQPQPHMLRNKRVQAVLRLFPYAHVADVGITSLPELTSECLGASAQPGTYRMRRRQPLGMRMHSNTVQSGGSGGTTDDWDVDIGEVASAAGADHVVQFRQVQAAAAGKSSVKFSCCDSSETGLPVGRVARRAALSQDDAADVADPADAAAVEHASEAVHDNPAVKARAFRALAYLLHGEAVGLEAWASSAATLSLDGYGPPFRLPQQLLLPAAVLKQASPYQTWLDWDLQPGVHYEQFAYDLSDLEEKVFAMLGVSSAGSSARGAAAGSSSAAADSAVKRLRSMAEAAQRVVVRKVDVFAQLDAFAWSVARYKEACPWDVAAPAAGDRVFHAVQLHPSEVFNSPGVPESVRLQVMRQLHVNFKAALQLPAYAAAAEAVFVGTR